MEFQFLKFACAIFKITKEILCEWLRKEIVFEPSFVRSNFTILRLHLEMVLTSEELYKLVSNHNVFFGKIIDMLPKELYKVKEETEESVTSQKYYKVSVYFGCKIWYFILINYYLSIVSNHWRLMKRKQYGSKNCQRNIVLLKLQLIKRMLMNR